MTSDSPQERFRNRWSGSAWASSPVIGTLLIPGQFVVARGAGAAAGATASSDAPAGKATSKKAELRRTGLAEKYMVFPPLRNQTRHRTLCCGTSFAWRDQRV